MTLMLDVDEQLSLVEGERKEKLGVAEATELLRLLRRAPLTILQKQILQRVNGQLNALAVIDLRKDGAMLDMARTQGVIMGLRAFFDIAAELVSEAEPEGGLL